MNNNDRNAAASLPTRRASKSDAVTGDGVEKPGQHSNSPATVRMVIVLLVMIMLIVLSGFVLLYQRVSA